MGLRVFQKQKKKIFMVIAFYIDLKIDQHILHTFPYTVYVMHLWNRSHKQEVGTVLFSSPTWFLAAKEAVTKLIGQIRCIHRVCLFIWFRNISLSGLPRERPCLSINISWSFAAESSLALRSPKLRAFHSNPQSLHSAAPINEPFLVGQKHSQHFWTWTGLHTHTFYLIWATERTTITIQTWKKLNLNEFKGYFIF